MLRGFMGNWIHQPHEHVAPVSPSDNHAAAPTGETGLDQRLEVPGHQPNEYCETDDGDI